MEREDNFDRLVQYNCHSKVKTHIKSTNNHILSLAVSDQVIAVIESKMNAQKMIVEVSNELWAGEELIPGRRISKVDGELDINSYLRGLNSLLIDKNKLIILDWAYSW